MMQRMFLRQRLSRRNSAAEQAALVQLIEECGEVSHAALKALRFGLDRYHPDVPDENNAEQIEREVDDVNEAFKRLQNALRPR